MVWRIHFSEADLARTQVSPTLGPLAETVLALALLRCSRQPRTMLSEWRGQVRVTPRMRPLTALIPPDCNGVDLPTLVGETATIEQGVQALLDVPREHLLVEMEWIDRRHRLPPLAWAMAEAGGRPELAEATQVAYQELIQPFWPRIRASLHAEQAARRRTLAAEGPGALLASLQGPLIRWRPPVLEILRPGQVEMELGGRGIALVPSVFVGRAPSLHENPNDEDEMPRLVLPAEDAGRARLWAASRERAGARGSALAALVGRNRAAVLQSIADGCTTTELARRVGISLAAASQHASVLRKAGLIATRRQGSAVLHVLTPLGAELLHAG
jgi:DNA-binding transcriptional ArsR family regulator